MSLYDALVLESKPCLYLPMEPYHSLLDLTNKNDFAYLDNTLGCAVMPNGDYAARFNGNNNMLSIRDADHLSIDYTGELTIEAWIRPDVLQFPKWESSGYVHWLGKGDTWKKGHEYLCRIYNFENSENRPNRISGYAFNPEGGFGAGASFQEPVIPGEWIHVVVCYTTANVTKQFPNGLKSFPTGYVSIYKNGIFKNVGGMIQFDIAPKNGPMDLFIGTRDLRSFFLGGIGKLAIYNRLLMDREITAHHAHMKSLPLESI